MRARNEHLALVLISICAAACGGFLAEDGDDAPPGTVPMSAEGGADGGEDARSAEGGATDGEADGGTLCGNGSRDVGEVCDDGNNVSGDGCKADCSGID